MKRILIDNCQFPINFDEEQREQLSLTDDFALYAKEPQNDIHKNVFVTRSGIASKNLNLIQSSIPHYPGYRKHFRKYLFVNYFLKQKKKLKGKYALVHNHWCPGYFHWITEALPRLISIKPLLGERRLLIPNSYPKYVFDSLELLGVDQIERVEQNLSVEDLLIAENVHFTSQYDIDNILLVRDQLLRSVLGDTQPQLLHNLYLSRKYAPRRKISNDSEVLSLCDDFGFQIYYAEKDSLRDQIIRFANTRLLLSIHGAGLTNLLFMPRGATVIELMKASDWPLNLSYLKLANLLGIQFYLVFCESTHENTTLYSGDIQVDISELSTILKEIGNE